MLRHKPGIIKILNTVQHNVTLCNVSLQHSCSLLYVHVVLILPPEFRHDLSNPHMLHPTIVTINSTSYIYHHYIHAFNLLVERQSFRPHNFIKEFLCYSSSPPLSRLLLDDRISITCTDLNLSTQGLCYQRLFF